jgi:uncharacterized protein YndB with AHSA1/START domain
VGFFKKLILLAVLIIGGLWFYGRKLPREHTIKSSIILVAPIDTVFKVIRNIDNQASWLSDVKSVRPLEGRPRESWEQNTVLDGLISLEVTSVSPPGRMVTTILNDDQQNWGGRWTYDVFTSAAGTEVAITEAGWVDPPLYRVYMKVRGQYRSLDSFLSSLGANFGEPVTPRHAR